MACLIVAEGGVNHGGSLDVAKRLVDAAKAAGADCVKFQLFSSRKLWGDDRIRHLELRFSEMTALRLYCQEVGIEFMCTPFGAEEVILLSTHVKRWKLASGCLERRAIIDEMRSTGKPIIASTGMHTFEQVLAAMSHLGTHGLTLLHCTSAYPAPISDVNLMAMTRLRQIGVPVGYSDHTLGITVPIAAAALGATVIEKHLTLDCRATGPDHAASIEPKDFACMVRAIRDVETALGDGVKRVMPSEAPLKEAWVT